MHQPEEDVETEEARKSPQPLQQQEEPRQPRQPPKKRPLENDVENETSFKRPHFCTFICRSENNDDDNDAFNGRNNLMGLQDLSVRSLAHFFCSSRLLKIARETPMNWKAELTMALFMRGPELVKFLQEKVNPRLSRLSFFLRDLDSASLQRLAARIFYEASRAQRRDDFALAEKLTFLLRSEMDSFPAGNDFELAKIMDPLNQLGLWHLFLGLRKGGPFPHIVQLMMDYYSAHWLPVFNMKKCKKRILCWTDEFPAPDPFVSRDTLFFPPSETIEIPVEPAIDSSYGPERWLLSALRGMADANADGRFAETLALGFHLIEKLAPQKDNCLGAYRIDIWGHLAIACAGIDIFSRENAFNCLQRMKECSVLVSDKCSIQATEARIRELVHLDTSIVYSAAKNDPLMIRSSHQFFEILKAHFRALFHETENLFLALLREQVYHSACVWGPRCWENIFSLKNDINDLLGKMFTITCDTTIWPAFDGNIMSVVGNYRTLACILDEMMANVDLRNLRLKRLADFSKNLDTSEDQRFDWPTLWVYRELATHWAQTCDVAVFGERLNKLQMEAENVVDQGNSRLVADMLTSAFILSVFGRDLQGDHNTLVFCINQSLLDFINAYTDRVPKSFSSRDFRTELLQSISLLNTNPDLKHNSDGIICRADPFWIQWGGMGDPRCRNVQGFSELDLLFYRTKLGPRMKRSAKNDNAAECRKSENERDLKLIAFLRASNFAFLPLAEEFGRQRLGHKRRF